MPHRRAWRRIKMFVAPEKIPAGPERREEGLRKQDKRVHRLRNMWLGILTLIMLYVVISLQHQIGTSAQLRYAGVVQRCDQEQILIQILEGFNSLDNPFSQKLVKNYIECRQLQ